MKDLITVRGFISSDITELTTSSGTSMARFRLGATDRRFNREHEQWEDGHTNWFTVCCYRTLAVNAVRSLHKGHRIIIVGKLKINHWEKNSVASVNPEIEAESIGHDLTWGTSTYLRNTRKQAITPDAAQPDALPTGKILKQKTNQEPKKHSPTQTTEDIHTKIAKTALKPKISNKKN